MSAWPSPHWRFPTTEVAGRHCSSVQFVGIRHQDYMRRACPVAIHIGQRWLSIILLYIRRWRTISKPTFCAKFWLCLLLKLSGAPTFPQSIRWTNHCGQRWMTTPKDGLEKRALRRDEEHDVSLVPCAYRSSKSSNYFCSFFLYLIIPWMASILQWMIHRSFCGKTDARVLMFISFSREVRA